MSEDKRSARMTTLRGIGSHDGMQIVPTFSDHELLTDPEKGGAALGDLAPHQGIVIPPGFQVYNIYVNGNAFKDDKADFDAFTKALCEDGYYVSPDGKQYGGTFQGSISPQVAKFRGTVTDKNYGAWVESIVGTTLPRPPVPTLYALILPPTLGASMDRQKNCTAFCGYHTHSPKGLYYSIICDAGCTGCHGSFRAQNARQMVQSHELGEWISDPLGTGWYNDQTGAENGDQCAWNRVPWGPSGNGWAVQPLWVNGNAKCADVPAWRAA